MPFVMVMSFRKASVVAGFPSGSGITAQEKAVLPCHRYPHRLIRRARIHRPGEFLCALFI